MDLSLTPEEEKEIMEMFSFEAHDLHEEINNLLTTLEANPKNIDIIDQLFRVTHTLKGSALGMGFKAIGDLSHIMEDVFGEIKEGNIDLDANLFDSLFKACDKLKELINNIKENKKISHKGIKTKLEVILRKSKGLTGMEHYHGEPYDNVPELPNRELVPDVAVDRDINPISEIPSMVSEKVIVKPNMFGRFLDRIKSFISLSPDHEIAEEVKEGRQGVNSRELDELSLVAESTGEDDFFYTNLASAHDAINLAEQGEETDDLNAISFSKEDRPALTTNDDESAFEFFDNLSKEEAEPDEEEKDLLKGLLDKAAMTDLVQVPIRKLDNLMNQVGQLIIERDRLIAENAKLGSRNAQFAGLQRITSDLQYSVMDVRLVQIGVLFNKFHRIARDVANIEAKHIHLELKGLDVEIDRNILKIMSDSMIHLVRNAVGHGLETPEERRAVGKPEIGTITLSARNEKDHVIIEVTDDGKGIDANSIRNKILQKGLVSKEYLNQLTDQEIILYIFETGFSNTNTVSAVSGRGVGMDVVKKSTESIGGQVHIATTVGKGTTISLRLPSSMAVKGVLMFQMKDQEFAFPLAYTEAVINLKKSKIRKAGIGLISKYLKHTISIIFFEDLLRMKDFSEIYETSIFHDSFDERDDDDKFDVIIVSYAGKFIGVIVDKLLQQKEIIEKTLPKPLDDTRLLSGTTILGNGNVCMIVDVIAITDILFRSKFKVQEQLKAS